LRAVARSEPHWPSYDAGMPVNELGARSSHPDWMVAKLVEQFGADDAVAFLRCDNAPPMVTLRANIARNSAGELLGELRARKLDAQLGELAPTAVVLNQARDPSAIAAVRDGRASPQDQASQAVVAALDPHPGDRVLDLAAAPGGKAAAAAELMGGRGVVIAADLHPGRVGLVATAAARLGLSSLHPLVANGVAPPFAPAPCNESCSATPPHAYDREAASSTASAP